MVNYLEDFTSESRLNTTLFSIGNSVSGKPLSVVTINQPGTKLGVPNIKFIGNIHGNEVLGREILLYFLQYLDAKYTSNVRVKCLLDNARLYILPSMNPDGFDNTPKGLCMGNAKNTGRWNNNEFDLNRNFPDFVNHNASQIDTGVRENTIQPETEAVMDWMDETSFVLSASFHGGALVVSYPFDAYQNEDDRRRRDESKTPDHDVFVHLAKTYVKYHENMAKGIVCPMDDSNRSVFIDGITNGAKWYDLRGGMQDYNYIKHGIMELTLEIACCKYPSEEKLPEHIQQNFEPLLRLSLQALRGVKGLVLDRVSNQSIADASLVVNNREIPFRSNENGEFWRILLPGTYQITVEASGYEPQSQEVTVQNYKEHECPDTEMTLIYMTPRKK